VKFELQLSVRDDKQKQMAVGGTFHLTEVIQTAIVTETKLM